MLIVLYHVHTLHRQRGYGIEIDAAMSILVSFEGIAVMLTLTDIPMARIAIVTGDIHQQALLVFGTERITMESTAQGGGQLCLHLISLQPYTVISGVCFLALVGEV